MKKFILYNIIFEDGSCFVGGDYLNTKWTKVPNKTIKRIFYTLPNGDRLCLEGYNKYYQMIEVTKDVYGKTKGKKRIEFAYIMGEKENQVEVYKISLINRDIQKFNYSINDNFIQKLNPEGWK